MTYQFLLCGDDEQYVLVDEGRFTLAVGEVWSFSSATGQILCGTVVQASPFGSPNFAASTQYEGCGDCLETIEISFTANTVENICLILCDDPSSMGTVATQVAAPHPFWTDNQGNTVVQGNAITLGGPNGLNS